MIWLLVVAALLVLIVRWRIVQILRELWDRIVFSFQLPGPGYFAILFSDVSENQALNWIIELTKTYGDLYRVWFVEDLTVFVAHPDHIRDVLSSHAITEKSADYKCTEMWLGSGLLTNGGESWHRQRKLLTPSFHFKILGTFKEPMEECCATFVRRLRPLADGERVVDVYPLVSLLALDVICETAMGIRIDAQRQSDSEFVVATKTICKIVHEQLFSTWQRFPILFNNSENGRLSREALKVLHGMTKRVIRERREEMAQEARTAKPSESAAAANDDEFVGTKKRFAFLDSLLLAQQSGVELSDKNIEDEVNTFMFEGHDTTSSAISFAMYMLSKHPESQQLAHEESVRMAGRESEAMPYLEAVIKETLRLYPSVPFYSRNVTEPIRIGEHTVPKGTTVAILAFMAHRNPKDFPEPERFDPDRYLGSNAGAGELHPFAHVAFSAGPRNCIGQRFAMLELKCTLSAVLREFELLPAPEDFQPHLIARLILNSANGVQMKLRRRQ